MVHAAEDATSFLHHACRGLPQRLNGHNAHVNGSPEASQLSPVDSFYARAIEHAVAYFGSRVLYPSRPAPTEDAAALSRAAVEKAAQAASRADAGKFESSAQEWGSRIGSQIYKVYLAGKVKPSGLRRLFLAHLHKPASPLKSSTPMTTSLPP